ncbi:ATP-dependent RNA helicase HrpA [Nocardioides rotundus]|uniref:ATP-dependent RNA helicase HrpA n=1 Tax=Nocardioides rotundus TaxID=1774216 RepID=UPI001CBE2175|nr:ATP-dependent RNA helicase HrpA [Nocardioides rotundus]UAL30545.1 ATP-dependent RNA helicase HrpA [Nocardioides rotundus]
MKISYPPELPVSARRDDIAAAIRDHQVVIVAGETGSGKTTQLPKIALELGRGRQGLIGHTQPRRIAARSVAERIGEELGTGLGEDSPVGYQVRFNDRTSRRTQLKLMTDGILLAELQRDRELRKYDTIIIDEAHERSLNIDFLLGYLKRLLPRRPDLKLIITSATIDPERFAAHFADAQGRPAPIIEVSGRTYPVEIRYRPLMELPEDDEDGEPIVRDQTEAVVEAVKELATEGPGDVLVFLPGEREIRDTADALYAGLGLDRDGGRPPGLAGHVEVLPLFSRLSAAEQHRIFSGHPGRRIVLATNVAETSLTVPGIRYVVDSGVARISRYSARTKVQRLPIEPISQASAQQRSGRSGRLEAGIAIRLYSEEDFEGRPEFTDPEILRTNLASVILQMASLGLGQIADFPFVEPPDRRHVTAGVQLLEELGALAPGPRLTRLGRRLARLPIDPRLGRMILEAERLGCVREVLVIVAALSVQDPRERPAEEQAQADQAHARFRHETSDFLTWLNLWDYLRAQQRELSSSAFRRMCKREHLNYLRVREWQELESQLRQVCKEMKIDLGKPAGRHTERGSGSPERMTSGAARDEDGIHQALLSGLLSQIGALEEREKPRPGARGKERRPGPREYLGARGTHFAIFPGSGLKGRNPQFLMAGELVETGRLWARQNAAIKPEWAERLGSHLVKRQHSEPHWSRRRAAVMAQEKVTLYGVPLVADRRVNYGRIDPVLARELFIRHALVYGEWDTRARFFHRNRRLLEEAEELEHRARRRDLVVDEHTLFDFYDARIPAEVVSGAHFDRWWKQERQAHPDLLTFDPAMLTHEQADQVRQDDFPTRWTVGDGLDFSIGYHFEPGAADDGLTIDLPVATLNQVDAGDFSWNVPGLRQELVTALIRSLPKQLRTSFVPAPDKAREFLAATPAGEEPLLDALERWALATTGVVIPREAWDWSRVEPHLRPTFRVMGENGREAARGKDLDALKAPLRPAVEEAVADAAAADGATRTGETRWVFGTVAESFSTRRAGQVVSAYPALVDEGTTVGLRVFGSRREADARHRAGVVRLLLLGLAPEVERTVTGIVAGLGNAEKLALAGSPYSWVGGLLADAARALVVDAVDAAPPVRTEEEYDALLAGLRRSLPTDLPALVPTLTAVLAAWREADRALSGRADMQTLTSLTDMQAHLSRLVYDGFVGDAGAARLRRVPAYLSALQERRRRMAEDAQGIARDRQLMAQIADLQDGYLHQVAALPPGRPVGRELADVGWLVEEYRIQLWAQQLGTQGKVSDQRIRKALAAATG